MGVWCQDLTRRVWDGTFKADLAVKVTLTVSHNSAPSSGYKMWVVVSMGSKSKEGKE